jgi:RHS repeat-associated protein
VTKIYWYDPSGNVLDETDGTGSATNSAFNEYVLFGSQRIARRDSSNDAYYYFADHLGTSLTIAEVPAGQSSATLCYDADFYSFGGERPPIVNTCSQNYKFTGKERDSESALDDFGARYFGSSLGRFMSPDGPFSDQNKENPQSWNLYPYARNNPLRFTDADGRACVQQEDGSFKTVGTEGQSCEDAAKEDENVSPSVVVTPSHDDQIKMFAEDIGNIGTAELKQDVLIMAVGAAGVAADAGIGILGARGAVARGGIAPVLKGAAGVARAEAEVAAEGGQVLGEEVTIQNSAGKARADFVYRDANGNLVVGEAKNGPTAALNPNQKAVDGQFEKGGGQFVGGNARQAGLPQSVGPTQVRVFKY